MMRRFGATFNFGWGGDEGINPSTRRFHGRLVADRLNLVAVGIADIGAVIVRMIVLAKTRRAFIRSAMRKRGCVEGIDLIAAFRKKGNMCAVANGRGLAVERFHDPHLIAMGVAIAGVIVGQIKSLNPQAGENGVVKRDSAGHVIRADGRMAEHGVLFPDDCSKLSRVNCGEYKPCRGGPIPSWTDSCVAVPAWLGVWPLLDEKKAPAKAGA